MKTIFDHLRECAGNGDMPTLDAEDAQRIVETYDELLEVLGEALNEYSIGYVLGTDWVAKVNAAIKHATESRPLQIERG